MDLYSSDAGDISAGNMRSSAQSNLLAGIQSHNQQIASRLQTLKGQQESGATENAIEQTISGYIGKGNMQRGLQAYKEWKATGQNKMNALHDLKSQAPSGSLDGDVRVGDTPAESPSTQPSTEPVTDEPSTTASPEGTPATDSSNVNPSAEEHEAITVGEDGAGKEGSMLHNGLKSVTGLSDDSIEQIGKGAGTLASVGAAGLDIYKDVEDGEFSKENAFPPAEALGGLLDVIGGVSSAIGSATEGVKQADKTGQKIAQTDTQDTQDIQTAVAQAPTVALARTE
jgi:hypothetical protein